MTDKDPIPWGKYRGKPIGEVPFDYLLKFYRKQWISGEVLIYFENALRILEKSELEMSDLTRKKPKKYLIENYEDRFPYKNN